MNYTPLEGKNVSNDADIIINNYSNNNSTIYVLTHPSLKLFAYIDALNDAIKENIRDNVMFDFKICYERRNIDVSLVADNSDEEEKINSMTSLISRLDGSPCKIIINNDDRAKLADISQQLIFIGYPLTQVNIMLRKEEKDSDKTLRFMKNIDNISDSIDSAIANINALSDEWNAKDLADKEKSVLNNIINDAKQRCISIQEKVAAAKKVKMTVAVAASKKTGKSVIVNSMIGEEYAPTSLILPTPNTCIYTKSEDELYHIELVDTPDKYITLENKCNNFTNAADVYKALDKEFKQAATAKERELSIGDLIIKYVTNSNNFDSFTIFDTPGPDLAGAAPQVESAKKAMQKSDVAIFAIDYSKNLTDDEVKYLTEIKKNFNKNQKFASLIFAINKMDMRYTDPNVPRSTIYIIDFIRNRLLDMGDLYNDCIVFATSALQYYNTIHCEKEIGSEFSEYTAMNNLDDMIISHRNVATELDFIEGIAKKYKRFHGFKTVTANDLKQYSGMPDLLNYTEYICKSKARDEIVNNITVTIDANNKALKAIRDRIANIDMLIAGDEEQIQRIKEIINEYSKSIDGFLSSKIKKEEISQMENNTLLNNAKADISNFDVLRGYFEINDKNELTLNDICEIISENVLKKYSSDNTVYNEILEAIYEKSYDTLKKELYLISDEKGRVFRKELDSAINKVFSTQNVMNWTKNYINGKMENEKDWDVTIIKKLSSEIELLIQNRISSIQKASVVCKENLKKFDITLELPQMPEFTFDMPQFKVNPIFNTSTINIKVDESSIFEAVKGKAMSKFTNFFHTIFNDHFGDQTYYIKDLERKDYSKAFNLSSAGIRKALENAEAYSALIKETQELIKQLKGLINYIDKPFSDVTETLKSSVKKFTDLVDDTKKHKENIEAHNREKMLIEALTKSTESFSDNWDSVLNSLDNQENNNKVEVLV